MNDDAHTTSITATTASALSNNNGKLRKQTKPELIKTAGYANREKKKIKSQCNILKTQLKMQELEHAQALSKEKALLKDKSEQCKHLATLAQQHRRAANLSQQQADSQVSLIAGETRVYQRDADSKVEAAEAGATTTIRAERAYQQAKMESTAKKHASAILQLKRDNESTAKELEHSRCAEQRQLASYHANVITVVKKDHAHDTIKLLRAHQDLVKEKDNKLNTIKKQCDSHKTGKQSALLECQQLKKTHTEEMDRLRIEHKAELTGVKAELRAALAEAVSSSEKKIVAMKNEQVELMNTYHGMIDEDAEYRRQLTATGKKIRTLTATSQRRLIKMREAKYEHQKSSDEVVREKRVIK